MDEVENELKFHRRDGDLEMVIRLEWRNLVQSDVCVVPRVDGPLVIERGDPHLHHRSSPTYPLRTRDRVRELKPTASDLNGGTMFVRRRQDSKLAVAKVMKPIASRVWAHEHWLHEIRITQSYRHQNICAFLDAYCTPTNATLYFKLCDLSTLKDPKKNMDANGQKIDEIHVLDFLV
jgi:serine/threonine protein kinase